MFQLLGLKKIMEHRPFVDMVTVENCRDAISATQRAMITHSNSIMVFKAKVPYGVCFLRMGMMNIGYIICKVDRANADGWTTMRFSCPIID